MAVLAEAISVIFKCASLDEKYGGGAKAFADFCRRVNNSYCCDGELARLGFIQPNEAKSFVEKATLVGLVHVKNGACVDMVVVDQRGGPLQRCEWIDFGIADLPGEPAPKVAACRMVGTKIDEVTVPDGWRYETSISRKIVEGAASAAKRAAQAKPPLAVYAKGHQPQPPLELQLGLRRVKK